MQIFKFTTLKYDNPGRFNDNTEGKDNPFAPAIPTMGHISITTCQNILNMWNLYHLF